MESICEVNPRNKLNEELLAGFIPMASVREGFSNYHDVNTKKWGDIKSGYTHLRDNDVMVAKITPCFQNRKSAIVANLPNGHGAGSTEFHIARTFDEKIIPAFLLVLFKSEYFIQKGLATFTGTAGQQRISSDFFSAFFVALPPTNEQFRLVRAVQNRLQALNDIENSRRRYKRILSETPTSLRQQLIQAAIQGLLVPQNPNDEPASKLLERIVEERTAKLGKKAAKSMSRIVRRGSKTYELFPDGTEKDISDEIPFEIPDSWEWSTLGIVSINRDSERIPLSKAQRQGHSKIYDYYGASGVIDKVERYLYDSRLLLIGEDGANLLSRSTDIAFIAEGKYWVNNHAHVLDSHKGISLDYIKHYVNGISLVKYVTGSAQPKLTQDNLNAIIIPVPPTDEQLRIVEKIESILSTLAL